MEHYRGIRRWSIALMTGFLIVLLSAGLADCGYNGAAQGQGGAPAQHPAQAQTTQAPRQTPTQTTRPASHFQQCGVVFGYGALETVPQSGDQSARAEDCFWQAFQHCRPAQLIFTTSGIAVKVSAQMLTRTFIIRSANGSCSLIDIVQHGTFPNALQPASATYLCTGLKRQPNALEMLSCGRDGTVNVLGM